MKSKDVILEGIVLARAEAARQETRNRVAMFLWQCMPAFCPVCRKSMSPMDAPEGCATRVLIEADRPAIRFSCTPCKQVMSFCGCQACFP